MANVLVLGAGLNGLSTAVLLALDGHDVTVVERDPGEPTGGADELWSTWERRGVNQFRLPHFMMPRWRALMETELPAVLDELLAMGALETNIVSVLPTELTGGWRDGDERFGTVTARRPVLEAAVAAVASQTSGLTVRRGVAVTGLVTSDPAIPGVPHVTGVLTNDGTAIRADLVVDTTGRRSAIVSMLDAVGASRPIEEREDSGFVYYCRHFRSADGGHPVAKAGILEHFDSVSLLTLPCDNGTWSVTFTASAADRQLRGLRDPAAWHTALQLFPTAAHWGAGEAITEVLMITSIEDRYRRFVVDDEPVVTGLVAVGDAWACTNPSLGRGASIGLLHACSLRDLLRQVNPDEPEKLARRFDEATEATVTPLYRMTLGFDRHRLAEIDGDIAGEPYQTPDPVWAITKAMDAAKYRDPDILRGRSSIASLHATPPEVLATLGLVDKIMALGGDAPQYSLPGPDRSELLAAIGTA